VTLKTGAENYFIIIIFFVSFTVFLVKLYLLNIYIL